MTDTTHHPPEDRWQTIRQIWRDEKFFYGLVAGVALIVVWALVGGALFPNDEGYKTNLYTELISVITTIVVLDRLNERRQHQREERELKARLIRELRSNVNDIAKQAANELAEHSWLTDDSLRSANLALANLAGANLDSAQLEKAFLALANLAGANLALANLAGADLGGANLARADMGGANLVGAYMGDANLENAFLALANLVGADLEGANLAGANLRDVSLEGANLMSTYLKGVDLRGAKFDEQTVLPDAEPEVDDVFAILNYTKRWTPDTDMTRYTDPNHPDFWQPEWARGTA